MKSTLSIKNIWDYPEVFWENFNTKLCDGGVFLAVSTEEALATFVSGIEHYVPSVVVSDGLIKSTINLKEPHIYITNPSVSAVAQDIVECIDKGNGTIITVVSDSAPTVALKEVQKTIGLEYAKKIDFLIEAKFFDYSAVWGEDKIFQTTISKVLCNNKEMYISINETSFFGDEFGIEKCKR